MFQAQAKCNIIDHQCAPVIALCLRQDCKIQSTCCIRCIKIHRDCTDYIKLLDDEIPEEISQFETLRVWFSDTFDQIKQQIKQLEQMVILYFLPIDQYSMQPTLSNLNKLGQLLKSLKSQDILQLEEQKQNIGLILDRSLKMISDKNFQELKQIDAVVAPQEDKNFIEKYYKEGYELYRDKQYLEAIVCFDEDVHYGLRESIQEQLIALINVSKQILESKQHITGKDDRYNKYRNMKKQQYEKKESLIKLSRLKDSEQCNIEGQKQANNGFPLIQKK